MKSRSRYKAWLSKARAAFIQPVGYGIGILICLLFLQVRHSNDDSVRYFQRVLSESIRSTEKRIKALSENPLVKVVSARIVNDSLLGEPENALIHLCIRQQVILLIYNRDELRLWTSNLVVPDSRYSIESGESFLYLKNAWYLASKSVRNDITHIYLVPIKYNFQVHNRYLENKFSQGVNLPAYIAVEARRKKGFSPIYSASGSYLCNINILERARVRGGDWGTALVWVVLLLFFFGMLHALIAKALDKQRTVSAYALGILTPVTIRAVMLACRWPEEVYALSFFGPKIYATNDIFRSLGDLCLNIIFVAWAIYLVIRLNPLKNIQKLMPGSKYLLVAVSIFAIWVLSALLEGLFKGLVQNSNIPSELTNVLSVTWLTILGLAVGVFSFMVYHSAVTYLIEAIKPAVERRTQVILFALVAGVCLVGAFLSKDNIGAVTVLAVYFLFLLFGKQNGKLTTSELIVVFLLFSTVAAIKLLQYNQHKDYQRKIALAEKLIKQDDPVAAYLLSTIAQKLQADPNIRKFFLRHRDDSGSRVDGYLQTHYYQAYFHNYEIETELYDRVGARIDGSLSKNLRDLENYVASPFVKKIGPYSYQPDSRLGRPNYFSLVPVVYRSKALGTLVVRLNSEFIEQTNFFPDLLIDKTGTLDDPSMNYSYAFYENRSLVDKFGKYPYDITAQEFFKPMGPLVYEVDLGGFNHLVYNFPNKRMIVVSSAKNTFFSKAATFSYLFFFSILFFLLLNAYFFLRKPDLWTATRFLFKTRIQLTVVLGVVVSLIIVGWITISYIAAQYENQKDELISDQVDNLRQVIEREMPTDNLYQNREVTQKQWLSIAATHVSDLNLFDINGDILYTSLEKLFDKDLISRKMQPLAFFQMYVSGKTELLQRERIGSLNFISGYAPIRNSENRVVGYLELPYLANQKEENKKISAFLNTLINVYVFLFLVIGTIAAVLARSIAYPLTLIQENLRKIKIGNPNQTISWTRNDEIGDLIHEYNHMVVALEESAQKLASSEREIAWKEMAKQVAHEIKNPLTPLKLGIQHLERSWKDQDPLFNQKFKNFVSTFVQQIDSLSAIATEFSNFAKMPAPTPALCDVAAIAAQAINLFKEIETSEFAFSRPLGPIWIYIDKDQLLRVFNNLLKNAVQAIPTTKRGLITLSVSQSDERVIVFVQDNGTGISEAARLKIFTPTFTTKSSGMGLGLAFVKNIVEGSGGMIAFHSSNEGTRFTVTWPHPEKAPATSI